MIRRRNILFYCFRYPPFFFFFFFKLLLNILNLFIFERNNLESRIDGIIFLESILLTICKVNQSRKDCYWEAVWFVFIPLSSNDLASFHSSRTSETRKWRRWKDAGKKKFQIRSIRMEGVEISILIVCSSDLTRSSHSAITRPPSKIVKFSSKAH